MELLNVHMLSKHQCNVANNDSFKESSNVSNIANFDGNDTYHCEIIPETEPSFIPQLDGNDTITSMTSDLPPADQVYNYTLNRETQARRLVTNAEKSPIKVTINNKQNIKGKMIATNVTIECNAGVYLTAIKPVLDMVHEGWCNTFGSLSVVCTKTSERYDSGKTHRVCTQLYLSITDIPQTASTKVVLHLYHTADKIQVQGGPLLSTSKSSVLWLFEALIEPIVNSHINFNSHLINDVNSAIIENAHKLCEKCGSLVDQMAPHMKDQPIACAICGKTFHKRCTDRKGSRSTNWSRVPWHCPSCPLGNQTDMPSLSSPTVPLPGSQRQSTLAAPVPHTVQTMCSTPGSLSTSPSVPPQSALEVTETVDLSVSNAPLDSVRVPDITLVPGSQPAPSIRFPNNNTRQRSSNINTKNPDIEFLKTSLDTCRGTIAQQEAEIRKLKEALDIRNKRIIQLEGQVNHATEYIGGRGSDTDHAGDIVKNIDKNVASIMSKIECFSSTPVNHFNIHNNSTCHKMSSTSALRASCTNCKKSCEAEDSSDPHSARMHSPGKPPASPRMSTTNPDCEQYQQIITCQICDCNFDSENSLQQHVSKEHQHSCYTCEETFVSKEELTEHMETNHTTEAYILCRFCDYRCKSVPHLNYHIVGCHPEHPHVLGINSQQVHPVTADQFQSSSTTLPEPESL